MSIFNTLELEGLTLELNSIGSEDCRNNFRTAIKEYLKPNFDKLSETSQKRFKRNPLRILDTKSLEEKTLLKDGPQISDYWTSDDKDHFNEVCELLDKINIKFELSPNLVRGLDYYTRTTFEVTSNLLGAQNAICGGGRYDTLVEELDGPSTPCFGFALGLERLVSLVPFENQKLLLKKPDIFIVCLGDKAKVVAFQIAHELRLKGLRVERDYEFGSMKSQMRKANKSNCRFTLIIGESEIKSGKYILKNMSNSEQQEVKVNSLITEIEKQIEINT